MLQAACVLSFRLVLFFGCDILLQNSAKSLIYFVRLENVKLKWINADLSPFLTDKFQNSILIRIQF